MKTVKWLIAKLPANKQPNVKLFRQANFYELVYVDGTNVYRAYVIEDTGELVPLDTATAIRLNSLGE